jgi:hypothetical protein
MNWANLPRRDWRDLAGCPIEGGQHVIDASFYTSGHDLATHTRLRIVVYVGLVSPLASPRDGAERLLSTFVDRHAFSELVNRTNRFGAEEWRLLPVWLSGRPTCAAVPGAPSGAAAAWVKLS